MCWLAGVVRQQLCNVLQWPKLGFGGIFENGEFLRGRVNVAEAVAGGGECKYVGDGVAGKEDLENQFGS